MTVRRDAPGRSRKLKLDLGSSEELGRQLLEVLREEGDGHNVVFSEGSFWEYIEKRDRKRVGRWVSISEGELHRIIGSFDGSEYPGSTADAKRGKRTKLLRVSHALAKDAISRASMQAEAPEFFATAKKGLAFTNGLLRVTESGEIERLPHSAEHRVRAGYPFPYDPKAKRERFDKMQREHFVGDPDAQQKIECMQEHFGGGLFGFSTKYEKCLALPSDGGSGRSATLQIIEAAFPAGSVSHIDAKELRSAERRTRLVAKLLNFSDEVPPDAFLETEDFKKVVTGNNVTAEGKFRASYEFRPVALHVYPIQNIASSELSTAFFRRFNVVRYNRSFEGDPSRVYGLADEIIATEISGIVAYLVEGAARLRRQNGYTVPASHAAEVLRWRSETDTVTAFVAAEMVRAKFDEPRNARRGARLTPSEKHDWTLQSDLYPDYTGWCAENGRRKPVHSDTFSKRLKAIGVASKHGEKGTYYGVISRVRFERREKEAAKAENRTTIMETEAALAEKEHREPRRVPPGFFDPPEPDKLSPPLTLVTSSLSGETAVNSDASGDPDSQGNVRNNKLSGEKHSNSNTYNNPDRLTGDHAARIEEGLKTHSMETNAPTPVSLSGFASRSRKQGRSA
jgi:phage/plasmid-associated DNA primase